MGEYELDAAPEPEPGADDEAVLVKAAGVACCSGEEVFDD